MISIRKYTVTLTSDGCGADTYSEKLKYCCAPGLRHKGREPRSSFLLTYSLSTTISLTQSVNFGEGFEMATWNCLISSK